MFRITAGTSGKDLFVAKGCAECHRAGESAITWRLTGKTLTDIAASAWDHGLREPTATVHLELGEMREIVSYVWAQQFFQSSGEADRGRKVFSAKRCGSCHDEGVSGAPALEPKTQSFSEITMVSALWRHGPNMLALMLERKLPWPRFNAREMSDLIAYLNTRKPNDNYEMNASNRPLIAAAYRQLAAALFTATLFAPNAAVAGADTFKAKCAGCHGATAVETRH